MSKDQREIARKLRILRHTQETGHVSKTCRYFGVGRSSLYRWREAYRKHGDAGLVNRPPIPKWHANRIPTEVERRSSIFAASTTSAQCGSSRTWRGIMA